MNTFRFAFAILCGMFAVGCGFVATASAQQPQPQPDYAAVLTVKHMCCAKESVPAIRELSKLKGIRRVSVNYKTRTLMIEPTDVVPSPRAIWEVAERIKIEPMRLATPQAVFTSKPRY